jgi:hypothetical protein
VALSPASAAAGSPGFLLTINGANFSKKSIARWNGAALATIIVDDSTARAQVPASDVAAYGSGDVTVIEPGFPNERSGVSNVLVFRITPRAASN